MKDGLRDISSGISTIIGKASKLVSFVRHSCLAIDILEGQPRLQARNETRWISTYLMLKSILKVDTAKLDQLDCTNKLSKYELKVIKEVTDILSPFEMVTEKCQAQNEVTAGLIIPCVRGVAGGNEGNARHLQVKDGLNSASLPGEKNEEI